MPNIPNVPNAQGATDELQRTKDEVEGRAQALEVCRRQSAELEMRLGTVQVMLQLLTTDRFNAEKRTIPNQT